MKTQIKFQKILFLMTLILSAVVVVYGFSFCTTSVSYAVKYTSASNPINNSVESGNIIGADALYMFVMGAGEYLGNRQWADGWLGFNNLIVLLGIALVVLAAVQYIFSTNNRRNYYITNYISVAVYVVYALVVAIIGFWGVAQTQSLFNSIDFTLWETYYNSGLWLYYTESQTVFVLGYIIFLLLIVDAVLLVLSTVWKTLLMKGEKALLDGSKIEPDTDNNDKNENENDVLVEEGV